MVEEIDNNVFLSHGIVAKKGRNIEWEYKVLKELEAIGWVYAPKVLYKSQSILYLEYVGDGDLFSHPEYQKQCETILEGFHSIGWVHGDPHSSNWRIDSKTGRIWLLDYEFAYHRDMKEAIQFNSCPKDDMDILTTC